MQIKWNIERSSKILAIGCRQKQYYLNLKAPPHEPEEMICTASAMLVEKNKGKDPNKNNSNDVSKEFWTKSNNTHEDAWKNHNEKKVNNVCMNKNRCSILSDTLSDDDDKRSQSSNIILKDKTNKKILKEITETKEILSHIMQTMQTWAI